MFTTSFIVWLHTQEVNIPNRDTIYNTLHGSMHLLTIDTFVAIAISLVWMYLLKSFVKPLIYLITVSVPVVLVAFSIYPFVMSFRAPAGKPYGGQGAVMRWGSLVPAILSVVWVYTAWRSRYALNRAIGIIQLACRIIGENPALVLLSFGTLAGTCLFTWLWLGIFTRVFLTGNSFSAGKWGWGLSNKTVGLGIYYIVMYLWTLGISSGIHRLVSSPAHPFTRPNSLRPEQHPQQRSLSGISTATPSPRRRPAKSCLPPCTTPPPPSLAASACRLCWRCWCGCRCLWRRAASSA